VPKFGGEKALTKHLSVNEEALKNPFAIEDVKVEVVPKMINDSMGIGGSPMDRGPKSKTKVTMIKPKAPSKRTSRLSKATQNLYNLEEATDPEKPLHIDLCLYQMEDY